MQAYEQGHNIKRIHHMSNISTALKVLDSKKVKLVNINPSDVVDGKPSIVLGLCWTLILHFQVLGRTFIYINCSTVRSYNLQTFCLFTNYIGLTFVAEFRSQISCQKVALLFTPMSAALSNHSKLGQPPV